MRHGFIKVACATPSVKVADCKFNTDRIISLIENAKEEGVHLLVLPELCVTGSTCQDLFRSQTLLESAKDCISEIALAVPRNMIAVFGAPVSASGRLFSCAVVASDKKILGLIPKTFIPSNQSQFSKPLNSETTADFAGTSVPMGTNLTFTCEQMPSFCLACEVGEDYENALSPVEKLALSGATVIACPCAQSQYSGMGLKRLNTVKQKSERLVAGYVLANAGFGESTTDYVFTASNIISENGRVLTRQRMKEDRLLVSELDLQLLEHDRFSNLAFKNNYETNNNTIFFSIEMGETSLTRKIDCSPFIPEEIEKQNHRAEEILNLQSLGLEKRILHTNAKTAIIGISGGLDSTLALLATVKAFDRLNMDRSDIICVTMPCFGTTSRTKTNAQILVEELRCTLKTINIANAVSAHFEDIEQDPENYDAAFENSQARERTQVLMDMANQKNGLVVGTGDLSELALGWATYNGDHMSNYAVNSDIPKTLVQNIVRYVADTSDNEVLKNTLYSILETPISPELVPGKQETENIVGPYELHDFFLYYTLRYGFQGSKIYRLAKYAFDGVYDEQTILKWLKTFIRRFFSQQFKRSCMPDGPKVLSIGLSPRGEWAMASDACASQWLEELESSLS